MTSKTRTLFRPAHSRPAADADQQKENHSPVFRGYRHNAPSESSDDGDFDLYLAKMATPKVKATSKSSSQTPRTAKNNGSHVVVVSSEDDDYFENFLHRMKTPKTKKTAAVDSEDILNNFIVDDFSSDDDFIQKKPLRVPKSGRTPVSRACVRTPLTPRDSVFLSDDDDSSSDVDNGVVVTSTWRTRHKKPLAPAKTHKPSDALPSSLLTSDEEDDEGSQSPLVFQFPRPALPPPTPLPAAAPAAPRPPTTTTTQLAAPTRIHSAPPARIHSAPPMLDDSSTSEEEFASLLERLKKKNGVAGGDWPTAIHGTDNRLKTPVSKGLKAPVSKSVEPAPVDLRTPVKTTIPKPPISQTEPRQGPQSRVQVCKTPGCFLQSLSIPARNFKQTKEGLTSRLYQLYNTSVFDGKLPTDMSVTWNKKMRKTAGYCISGQERGGGKRYTRIELSEKVCDSADRLRDTLVHEMCHAATWLINGVRDGHGSFWKLYARKATLAHPELPVVTRCHSYDITYKFQYQCTRCKNTIGRHSKSLDTQRFMCALCTGPLVLLTPVNARPPTAFANFVKENYGNVRQGLVGKSHADVMRKLSADFATKTKLGQS